MNVSRPSSLVGIVDAGGNLNIFADRKRRTRIGRRILRGGQMTRNAENHRQLVYSVAETARVLNLSRAPIYRLIGEKKLATLKIGARRLVPVEAINALLSGSL
jgi:excisionase family DNA binding protein